MNYYQHHIGDYAAATAYLSLIEDAIYTRLLRVYYRDEKPLPADTKAVAWLIGLRSKKEVALLDNLLPQFFTLQDDGWHNSRADKEIAHYRYNKETAQENGKKGGRPKTRGEPGDNPDETKGKPEENLAETQVKPRDNPEETQQKPNANPEITQRKANQEPITNNHKPITAEETTNKPPPEARGREAGSSSSAPPEKIQAEPEGFGASQHLPDKIPDAATSRAVQIAVLLRRNGACHNTHAASKGIAEMVAENLPDVQILNALLTAKDQRKKCNSAQPITASYLLPIVRQLHNAPRSPPSAAQRRSDWSARLNAVLSNSTHPPPYVIDMGVIDAACSNRSCI